MSSNPAAPPGGTALTAETTTTYRPVDLAAYWNNRAISTAGDTGSGHVNVWGNSFPAEHLPPPGADVVSQGVPFVFPKAHPDGDNIRCAGQYLGLPEGRYDWIHLLATSERRTEDRLALHFADRSVDFEALRISDFWAEAEPAFGDSKVFETPVMHYPHHVQQRVSALLWSQRVPVTRRAPLVGLRLPANIAIHVFALTLQSVRRSEGRSEESWA